MNAEFKFFLENFARGLGISLGLAPLIAFVYWLVPWLDLLAWACR